MIRWSLALFFLLLQPRQGASCPAATVHLILDTDIGNDIDDALALAMIHAFERRGEAELLAVTISKDNPEAAPFVDLLNTFYGRPRIPIGVVRNGKTPQASAMLHDPVSQHASQGKDLFPHRLRNGNQAPEAVSLLTKTLQQQPDHSVTVVQIGFSTNLARLLQTPGGRQLIVDKVKLLSIMGGNFADGPPEYNIDTDPEAAAVLLEQWPTPMVFSGFEIGLAIRFPFEAFSNNFRYAAAGARIVHPVVAAAHSFFSKPEDRPAWDPTAVLYAIRPNDGYFRLSEPGRVSLAKENTTAFRPDPNGHCRYLMIDPESVQAARQIIVDLVTEPPTLGSRR